LEELMAHAHKDLDNRSKDLIEINDILKGCKIRFLLFGDTLLWAIGANNIVKGDVDIQLAIYAEEARHKLQRILSVFQENEFEILYIDPSNENLKINLRKRDVTVSLIGFHKKGKFRRRYLWKYPELFFKQLETIVVLDEEYWCPSPLEKYLAYQFGDWKSSKQKTFLKNSAKSQITSSFLYRICSTTSSFSKHLPASINHITTKVKQILFPSTREPLFNSMLMSVVNPCTTLIEVGSNDGRETCRVLNSTKGNMKGFLLEPDLKNLEKSKSKIKRNRYFNNQIQFLNLGVSHINKEDLFYLSTKKSNLNSALQSSHTNDSIKTKYVTLDWLIKEMDLECPLIIKMDIEGYEVEVLEGFKNTIRQRGEINILMEIHPALYTKKHSLKEKLEYLYNWGFRVTLMESAGVPVPYKFAEKGLTPICIKDTRGLYADIPKDVVLDFACNEHVNITNNFPWFTRKIVRSILLEKTV